MPDDLFSVSDQVTLVSGGSRGIGRAIAAGFAQRGARVIVTGRDAQTLERTAEEISTGDHAVRPVVCDVADPAAIERLVKSAMDEFGRVEPSRRVCAVASWAVLPVLL